LIVPILVNLGMFGSSKRFTLGSIIIPGDKTREGILVESVGIAWLAFKRAIDADPGLMSRITPRTWEEILAAVYKAKGFETVVLTHQSGDNGIDWIAEKRGFGAVRFVGQMKHYKDGHLVTAGEVRSMFGVLAGDPRASKAIVATTSDFAPRILQDPAIAGAVPTRLELMNGVALRTWLEELARSHPG
jgi:restriction system protein